MTPRKNIIQENKKDILLKRGLSVATQNSTIPVVETKLVEEVEVNPAN